MKFAILINTLIGTNVETYEQAKKLGEKIVEKFPQGSTTTIFHFGSDEEPDAFAGIDKETLH